MAKKKVKTIRQQENDAAVLRRGAGKHDTRPRGERDRPGQRRAWQRDQQVAA